MNIQEALHQLLDGKDLSGDDMVIVMEQIMTGAVSNSMIVGFLVALRMKGETVDEVAAAATVMRSLAEKVNLADESAIDIVGTGGDTTSTFNISTCSAIVAAAAGVKVAKHGARSVSSKSGAADLLEAAGVNIGLNAEQVKACIQELNLGFMFAPQHHSAMKHAIGPRRELGARTIFNLLGPLTNPAGVKRQLLGVFAKTWVRPIADVLQQLGSEHVLVVHGNHGMDEISISSPTSVAELKNGVVTEYEIAPRDFDMPESPLSEIQVGGAEESLAMVNAVLDNTPGAARDIVALNSGAAICVSGLADDIAGGVEQALAAIADGRARQKLDALARYSSSFSS